MATATKGGGGPHWIVDDAPQGCLHSVESSNVSVEKREQPHDTLLYVQSARPNEQEGMHASHCILSSRAPSNGYLFWKTWLSEDLRILTPQGLYCSAVSHAIRTTIIACNLFAPCVGLHDLSRRSSGAQPPCDLCHTSQ